MRQADGKKEPVIRRHNEALTRELMNQAIHFPILLLWGCQKRLFMCVYSQLERKVVEESKCNSC